MTLTIRPKLLIIATLFATSIVSVMLLQTTTTYAEPIPAGCPGSTQEGEPAPSCPEPPPGCPGYNLVGAAIPGVDCGDISTWPSYAMYKNDDEDFKECREAELSEERCVVSTDCEETNLNENNCAILKRLLDGINFLSAIVGVTVVIMIIVGGIQYTTAGSDPKKVAAAKGRIFNALLALFAYIFMFSFLQWVVPGGIF